LQDIGEKSRLLLQIEVEGAVIDLEIGDLDDDVLEGVIIRFK